MSSHVQELPQEGSGMKGVYWNFGMPKALCSVVVGTISREREVVIIDDKVVGVVASVPILTILLPLSGEVRGGYHDAFLRGLPQICRRLPEAKDKNSGPNNTILNKKSTYLFRVVKRG